MTNLTPVPGMDNVPQLEVTTPALGGPGGPMNSQAQALLNRTAALSTQMASANSSTLSGWAYTQTFQLVSATRDANSAIISASIVWPDGITGVFTTDVASVEFPGAIDAWHATYAGTPAKLITQPAVTRDVNGAVTAQPAITIV
jgi:hypothetical protein